MRLSTKLPKFNKKVARIVILECKESIDLANRRVIEHFPQDPDGLHIPADSLGARQVAIHFARCWRGWSINVRRVRERDRAVWT